MSTHCKWREITVGARALFRHAPTLRVCMLEGFQLLGRVWQGAVDIATMLFLVGRTRTLDGKGDASNKLGVLRGAIIRCTRYYLKGGGGGVFCRGLVGTH